MKVPQQQAKDHRKAMNAFKIYDEAIERKSTIKDLRQHICTLLLGIIIGLTGHWYDIFVYPAIFTLAYLAAYYCSKRRGRNVK